MTRAVAREGPEAGTLITTRGNTMRSMCTHLDQIRDVAPWTPDGCEECLQMGDTWVHLRLCRICGHVGCCDESKHRHATKSFHATGHPIIQSFERGEDWMWCHVDEVFLDPAPMSRDTTPDG